MLSGTAIKTPSAEGCIWFCKVKSLTQEENCPNSDDVKGDVKVCGHGVADYSDLALHQNKLS